MIRQEYVGKKLFYETIYYFRSENIQNYTDANRYESAHFSFEVVLHH